MKVKMKFNLSAIKGWLIEHGEKVAFGGMVLVFLLFAWSALRRETLDASKQPDVLTQKAQETRSYVEQSAWDPKREGVEVVDYSGRVKHEPLAVAAFTLPVPLNQPLADPKTKRDDPKLLPAEEVRASAGFAIFTLKGGGSSKDSVTPKAQPWAVVTGLVPVLKQTQEYSRVLEGTIGEKRERDVPHYAGFVIERAEVDPAQPAKLDWKVLPPSDEFEKQWDSTLEIVQADYVEPELTMKLGPLAGGVSWDESVAHPKIPLLAAATETKATAEEAAEKERPEAAATNSRIRRARPAEAKGADKAPAAKDKAASVPSEIAYRLLRVFDFTVEPKKKYRYRVTLALENPNFGLPPFYLLDPSKKREEVAESPVSEPTDMITIPDGYRVLVAGAGKGPRNDPGAKILVSRIDPQEGLEEATEMDVFRGSVANVFDRDLTVKVPNGGVKELTGVDIKTDVLVLDVHGGRPLSTKRDAAVSPVEVLILDPYGKMSVRNELDDESMVEHRKPPEAASKGSDPIPTDDPKPRARSRRGR
ncbi:MAG TPA: hypothetical protein VHV08_15155 [Pirellulales bacterium]|jgi:hypothetical protein|nr:hypothetical protein [Pirellulales bacterium]